MKKQQPGPLRLDALDQENAIDQEDYKKSMKRLHLRLLRLQRVLMETKRSVVVVVEGPDAAGKGGAIRRIVEKLDPRTVRVYSVVKPTAEEYRYHYMRRFWLRLPAYGEIAIFDRSWYGRVLVERVEGFATSKEWQRAYAEIVGFERSLTDDGALLVKLYLHISKEEQLARFKRRQADPYKHWKISDEDWRNRAKWKQHNTAAEAMFAKTSLPNAPWTVIPANFKWFARVTALQTVVAAIERAGIKA